MRRTHHHWPLISGLALLLAGPIPAEDLRTPFAFMRGMVVSCPRGGQIWGSPEMADSLAQLEELGVEWIAIHPYARVRRNGEVQSRIASQAGYLARANEMVRAAGLRFFWKPHLAYWGSFDWRGAIEFDDELAWNLFFSGYREFILDQARFAERIGAEIFAVGVELELTTHRPEWRQIIREVRDVYSGQLTYAANWDRLDRVPFWRELDLIGVHAYFPLSGSTDPSDEDLQRGWDAALAELSEISSEAGGKPTFFAEIGYNRSPRAAVEPWSNATEDSGEARRLRRRLIETATRRIEAEPMVRGLFWWKWIPGPVYPDDADFSMKDEEAMEVLKRQWSSGAVEQ